MLDDKIGFVATTNFQFAFSLSLIHLLQSDSLAVSNQLIMILQMTALPPPPPPEPCPPPLCAPPPYIPSPCVPPRELIQQPPAPPPPPFDVVFFLGSATTTFGRAGANNPESTFPTLVGTPKEGESLRKDFFFGFEAEALHELLNFSRPIDRATITDLNALKVIARLLIHENFRCAVSHPGVVLVVSDHMSDADLAKLSHMFLADNRVKRLCITRRSNLLAAKHRQGIVCYSSSSGTEIYSVLDGVVNKASRKSSIIGTRFLSLALQRKIVSKSVVFDNPTAGLIRCKDILQFHGTVQSSHDEYKRFSESKENSVSHRLPDGTTVDVGAELTAVTEIMFNPKVINAESAVGLGSILNSCMDASDARTCSNLTIYGGISTWKGIERRLKHDCPRAESMEITRASVDSMWEFATTLFSTKAIMDSKWVTAEQFSADPDGCIAKFNVIDFSKYQ